MQKTAAEWFVEGLRERGVEWIATLCGHGQDSLFWAARRAGIRLIDVRNEQTAAYIAEAYGRLTRRPGVCSVSSGVAVANGLTGVLNAWFDHAPMLMISGSHDLATLGMGCFQDLDQTELCRPVTLFSRILDCPVRVLQVLDEAWRLAQSDPPGPVHLMFPMDVQRAEVASADLFKPSGFSEPAGPSLARLGDAAARIARAERPLLIAGSCAYYAGEGRDLTTFTEEWAIPVQTPIWDRGVFDEESDSFVGVIGAASGGPPLLAQSDCVVLAGAAVDYRVGYLQGNEPAIRLTRGWSHLGNLLSGAGREPWTHWLATARSASDEYRESIEARGQEQSGGRLHAIHIIEAIESVLPVDSTLIIDGGSIGQWAHQLLATRRYPSQWLTCGRSGVVGYGLGAAMAARLANPSRPVLLLSGDGAFTFTVAEIECAVRQNLPFVAIVADDQCWGITHTGHLKQFGEGLATQLGSIRFDLLAQSMGAQGLRVERPDEIPAALRKALGSNAVTILHIPIVGGNP